MKFCCRIESSAGVFASGMSFHCVSYNNNPSKDIGIKDTHGKSRAFVPERDVWSDSFLLRDSLVSHEKALLGSYPLAECVQRQQEPHQQQHLSKLHPHRNGKSSPSLPRPAPAPAPKVCLVKCTLLSAVRSLAVFICSHFMLYTLLLELSKLVLRLFVSSRIKFSIHIGAVPSLSSSSRSRWSPSSLRAVSLRSRLFGATR